MEKELEKMEGNEMVFNSVSPDFEREVQGIFERRDFNRHQQEIEMIQKQMAEKREEKANRKRRKERFWDGADKVATLLCGMMAGVGCSLFCIGKHVSGLFLIVFSALFWAASYLICEVAKREL